MGMNANTLVDLFIRGTKVLLFVLALAVATGIRPSVAAIDLGQQRQFDIAPQQLSSALLKFSAQSDIQVTVPGQLVEGKNSPGVVGKFNPGSALAILLKDTALHYDVVDGSTVVIAGPSDHKLSRNDFQKINNSGIASAQTSDGREIKVAQATSTTAQTTSLQSQNAVSTSPASSDSNSSLAEIVVTGSSIKTINGETALPVQILKKDDIARTGATTVEELFRQISAASSAGATTAAQATGFQTGGLSTISLRGLGSERTLILINGQRSAVYGGGSTGAAGSSVDVSGIPLALVERVEVLKDGASAIYGSDAIAGVVNFIMREDYQGLEVQAYDGNPTKGGTAGNSANLSIYGGLGDLKTDRFNIAGGINVEHDKTLVGADRPFATRYSPAYGNDVTSGFAFPANVAVFPANAAPKGKGTQNPFAGNCAPSINDVNFPSQCRFDNSPYDSLQPDTKKGTANFSARYAVTDTSQLYAEGSYSHVEQQTQVQPVPLSYQNPLLRSNPYVAFLANLLATQYPNYHNPAITPTAAAFLLPPTSPYYPTAFATAAGINGQPLNLIYRDFANGPRLTEDTSDAARFVAGYKGTVGTWDYDSTFLYSEVKVKEDLKSGFGLYSKIMPLLDGGTINPFGPTTDPAALAAAKAAEFTGQDFATKTSITSLSGKATGELYALPAGPLSAAVGAEVRRETFDFNPAAAIATGDVTGQGGNQLPESAARNVESAYVEFNAQLLSSLQADAAVRYDNYQRVGNTINPKFSLRFQPIHQLLLRASAGTGFRAPSLTDLYAAQATSVTANGTRDPILCPKFDSTNPNCSFQFSTITGGNPNLTPEKSKSATFGISIEPVTNLTMDFDSFWIFLRNQIVVGGLGYPFILQNAATATEFASLVKRDPVTNQIISISQTNANLFKSNVSGLDSDVRYHFDVTDADRISLLANSTYFYRYVSQNPDGSWIGDLDKGLTSVGGVISRFRGSGTLEYQRNSLFNVSLTGNFQKRYHDSAGNVTGAQRYVSAYETLDAQASFIGLKNFTFTLGGLNILNKNPPYANYAASANNFIGGYDVSYGNPLGSFIYGRVVYSFH
jgi:iron complex outermembrane recepter protein